MYSQTLHRVPFQPDPSVMQHAEIREEYTRQLMEKTGEKPALPVGEIEKPEGLAKLLDLISPEDSALIALVVFLLCDNTNNDVVLLGILLYVLLSK